MTTFTASASTSPVESKKQLVRMPDGLTQSENFSPSPGFHRIGLAVLAAFAAALGGREFARTHDPFDFRDGL
jgi:hypothetical protein